MKFIFALALMPICTISLSACQKFAPNSTMSSGPVVHSADVPIGRTWTLASMNCANSGKDLMKFKIAHSLVEVSMNQTLDFEQAVLIQTNKFAVTQATELSGSSTEHLAYSLTKDAQGGIVLHTIVTEVDANELHEKMGIVDSHKVGDKTDLKYAATSEQLTLDRPSNGDCAASDDHVVSIYK